MAQKQYIVVDDFTGGMNDIQHPTLLQPNEGQLVENYIIDEENILRLTSGRSRWDSGTNSANGLRIFRYKDYWLRQYGKKVEHSETGSTWTDLAVDLNSDKPLDFTIFADWLYLAGGAEVISWNGVDAAAATALKGKYIEGYAGRIVTACVDCNTDLWYSHPYQDWAGNPGQPTIDWVENVEYVGEQYVGGVITGLRQAFDSLIVFKEDSIWAIHGKNIDTWQIFPIHNSVGCYDHRTIVSHPLGLIFAHRSGIYILRGLNAASVQEIGRPIWDTYRNWNRGTAFHHDEFIDEKPEFDRGTYDSTVIWSETENGLILKLEGATVIEQLSGTKNYSIIGQDRNWIEQTIQMPGGATKKIEKIQIRFSGFVRWSGMQLRVLIYDPTMEVGYGTYTADINDYTGSGPYDVIFYPVIPAIVPGSCVLQIRVAENAPNNIYRGYLMYSDANPYGDGYMRETGQTVVYDNGDVYFKLWLGDVSAVSGYYTSEIFFLEDNTTWGVFDAVADERDGTYQFQVRAGPTSTPDGSWTAWANIDPGDNIGDSIATVYEYFQFRVQLSKPADKFIGPLIRSVRFHWFTGQTTSVSAALWEGRYVIVGGDPTPDDCLMFTRQNRWTTFNWGVGIGDLMEKDGDLYALQYNSVNREIHKLFTGLTLGGSAIPAEYISRKLDCGTSENKLFLEVILEGTGQTSFYYRLDGGSWNEIVVDFGSNHVLRKVLPEGQIGRAIEFRFAKDCTASHEIHKAKIGYRQLNW